MWSWRLWQITFLRYNKSSTKSSTLFACYTQSTSSYLRPSRYRWRVWGLLLLWALRSGLFRSSGEAVKYRVFDDSDG